MADATKEMLPFIPRLPRSVKRMVNLEHLLISVAVSRDMIGGSPALSARHIGKWVVLLHRWPGLANAIVTQPGLLQEAEASDGGGDLDRFLAPDLMPHTTAAREQLARFLSSETKLSPVIDRLVSALPVGDSSLKPQALAPSSLDGAESLGSSSDGDRIISLPVG